MHRTALVAACLVGAVASVHAQQGSGTQPDPQAPRYEEQVEVVGVTPIHGIGLPKQKVPGHVQVFSEAQLRSSLALDLPSLLADRAAGVQVSDAQSGTFQPDLLFRGFAGSPLLGAAEGLAVYQDGVRINEPFGDTISWDALPSTAIASINLMPGSNPLFGLNALGGALSIRTKNGFDFGGQRFTLTTGSFGRHRFEAESGAHGDTFGYYVAGALTDETGWRDFSPSTVRRLFADLAWRGRVSALNVSITAASNDLTGNGPAPVALLEEDRDAVFTHPDTTDNDLALVTARGRRQISSSTLFEAVAYYRGSRIGTFNGDLAEEAEADEDDEEEAFAAANNTSRTRAHGGGATGQITRTAPLWGRDNHFLAGGGFDAAATRFDFASEVARLTPDRGTEGTGVFDEDELVKLDASTATASAFVTNTWSATSAVSLTGSARFNWTTVRLRDRLGTELNGDHSFARVNPAAGVTYQARPWLNAYASYTESSRVPTPVELTCADPDDPCRLPNAFVSDPPLDQVTGRTLEAGLRGSVAALDWSMAVFATRATDDIIFVSSGTVRGEGHFENVERTDRRGLEASVEYDVTDRLAAFGAYTLQRATFGIDVPVASRFHPDAASGEIRVERGDRLPGVPVHSGKAGLTVALTTRLSAGVSVRAQSGQFFRGDEANLLARLPGFTVVNAQARHRVHRSVTVVAQAHNIFDARFYTFGVLGDASLVDEAGDDPRFQSPGAPRAAWIGVELRF